MLSYVGVLTLLFIIPSIFNFPFLDFVKRKNYLRLFFFTVIAKQYFCARVAQLYTTVACLIYYVQSEFAVAANSLCDFIFYIYVYIDI